MTLKRVTFVAVVVAFAVLVPASAASAGHHRGPKIRLALVPLEAAQLGPGNASLPLNYGSGPLSNGGFISINLGSGQITGGNGPGWGYALDYGDPYTGSAGVTEIRTSVAEYRTARGAKRALRGGRFEDKYFEPFILQSPFAHLTVHKVKPAPVGQQRFGFVITQSAPNLNPIVRVDEQVAAGRFVLDLTVTAGSESAAEHAAPHLLRVLHRRLQLALNGGATGHPPKPPDRPKPGQAPGGPDLSTLILQPTDVGQSHAVNLFQGYTATPPALSSFVMILEPAGTYDGVIQQIGWWQSATEAMYAEIYGASQLPFLGIGLSFGPAGRRPDLSLSSAGITPVDLSSLDDPATGFLLTGDGESEAVVELSNGQAGETVIAFKEGTLQSSDVLALAQAAADRLDAGLGP